METKFNIGQKVYGVNVYIFKDRASASISYGKITKMELEKDEIKFFIGDSFSGFTEENLFLTKEEAQQQVNEFWKQGE